MRIVFIGAGAIAVQAAKGMLKRGHEVVIVEKSARRIDQLSSDLDCGFIHGDGARPGILREVGPETTDFLFCLGDDDADNIIAALVAQSLEFGRVVVQIEEQDYESICSELGIETIVPHRRVARELEDKVEGHESPHLAALLKGGVRFFSFIAEKEHTGAAADLELPAGGRIIALNREDDTLVVEPETKIRQSDEVVILAREEALDELEERFGRKGDNRKNEDEATETS